MTRFKGYWLFGAKGYRIVMLILLPLFLLGVNLLNIVTFQASMIYVYLVLVVPLEVFADYWFLGGICEKDAFRMNFVKSSGKGKAFIRNVICSDVIRRAIYFMGIGIFGAVTEMIRYASLPRFWSYTEYYPERAGVLCALFLPMAAYVVVMVGVNIVRHFSSIQTQMMAATFCSLIYGAISMGGAALFREMAMHMGYMVACVGVVMLLAIGISIFTIKYIMGKVEGSYYDE